MNKSTAHAVTAAPHYQQQQQPQLPLAAPALQPQQQQQEQQRRVEPLLTHEVLPWPVIEPPAFCNEIAPVLEPPENCFIFIDLPDTRRTFYTQANPQCTAHALIQHMRELLVHNVPATGYLILNANNNNNSERLKSDIPLSEQNITPSNATKTHPVRLQFKVPTPQQLQQEAAAAAAADGGGGHTATLVRPAQQQQHGTARAPRMSSRQQSMDVTTFDTSSTINITAVDSSPTVVSPVMITGTATPTTAMKTGALANISPRNAGTRQSLAVNKALFQKG